MKNAYNIKLKALLLLLAMLAAFISAQATTVDSFLPASGKAGTTVTISGSGFIGASNVYFNGTNAAFTFVDDNTLTATVPTSATTGAISVKVGSTTQASAANFTVCTLNAQVKNVSATLTASGTYTLNAASFNNGSTSSCGPLSFSIIRTGTASGIVGEAGFLQMDAPAGAVFTSVNFASYGNPNGSAYNFTLGACHALNSQSLVEGYLLGNNNALIPANNNVFGDPCSGVYKHLAVTATYGLPGNFPQYDFTCSNTGVHNLVIRVADAAGNVDSLPVTFTLAPAPTATITHVSATAANIGDVITVTGTNLSGADSISVNRVMVATSNVTATGFTFEVPAGGMVHDSLRLKLACNQYFKYRFTACAGVAATISGASPASGKVGDVVTVTGANFDYLSMLAVNGVQANAYNNTGTSFQFVIPQGVSASGNIAVTLPCQAPVNYAYNVCLLTLAVQNASVTLGAKGNVNVSAANFDNGTSSTCSGVSGYVQLTGTMGMITGEDGVLNLDAPAGAVFTAVTFASYGTPNGSAGNFSAGSCHAANSQAIVEGYVLGKSSISIPATNAVFGDPCYGTYKHLAIQVTYAIGARQTSLAFNCANVGTQQVNVTYTDAAGNEKSELRTLTIAAPATASISNVSPAAAAPGTEVTVTGAELAGVDTITVNGAKTLATQVTAEGFKFVVPQGAADTGSLVINVACYQTLSQPFNVVMPLPVTLISFTGSYANENALLKWSTASEVNNSGFVVQRSANGKDFSDIGFVKAAGSVNELNKYEYSDELPGQKAYYRLKQVDVNGSSTTTRAVVIEAAARATAFKVSAYPNPFKGSINLMVNAGQEGIYNLAIVNSLGVTEKTVQVELVKGDNLLGSLLEDAQAGVYIIKLSNATEARTVRVVKQR